MAARAKKRGRRPTRSSIVRRWLAVGVLALVAFLYYRPLVTFLETRSEVGRRNAEVAELAAEKQSLERTLAAQTSTQALVREARRIAYVKPGERLFIVKGIPEWRRAHARKGSTIGDDG